MRNRRHPQSKYHSPYWMHCCLLCYRDSMLLFELQERLLTTVYYTWERKWTHWITKHTASEMIVKYDITKENMLYLGKRYEESTPCQRITLVIVKPGIWIGVISRSCVQSIFKLHLQLHLKISNLDHLLQYDSQLAAFKKRTIPVIVTESTKIKLSN